MNAVATAGPTAPAARFVRIPLDAISTWEYYTYIEKAPARLQSHRGDRRMQNECITPATDSSAVRSPRQAATRRFAPFGGGIVMKDVALEDRYADFAEAAAAERDEYREWQEREYEREVAAEDALRRLDPEHRRRIEAALWADRDPYGELTRGLL